MSAPKKSKPRDSQGVLSNLPRTRPQRSSPHRAAARKATAATAASATPARANGGPAAGSKAAAKRAAKGSVATRSSAGTSTVPKRTRSAGKRASRGAAGRASAGAATVEPVPRQGFECEGERPHGPVQPPGATELVAGAAEIVGELTRAGFSAGERLLKDALSRLPLS